MPAAHCLCQLAYRVKPSHISACVSTACASAQLARMCALSVCSRAHCQCAHCQCARVLSCAHARTRSARQHSYSTPVCSRARRLCTRKKKCSEKKKRPRSLKSSRDEVVNEGRDSSALVGICGAPVSAFNILIIIHPLARRRPVEHLVHLYHIIYILR